MTEFTAVGNGLSQCAPGLIADFRDSFLAGGGLSAGKQQCGRDALTDERIREVVIASFAGNPDDPTLGGFDDEVAACVA
ncbi:MAG: hypothetical protein U5K30_08665 [Acidimicrobiales bacterium]|nr:hypothetical protein [Acidimicrobiales bacterium]